MPIGRASLGSEHYDAVCASVNPSIFSEPAAANVSLEAIFINENTSGCAEPVVTSVNTSDFTQAIVANVNTSDCREAIVEKQLLPV